MGLLLYTGLTWVTLTGAALPHVRFILLLWPVGCLGMSFSMQWKKHQRASPISELLFHACVLPHNILLTKQVCVIEPRVMEGKVVWPRAWVQGWENGGHWCNWPDSSLSFLNTPLLLISSHCFLLEATAVALCTCLLAGIIIRAAVT